MLQQGKFGNFMQIITLKISTTLNQNKEALLGCGFEQARALNNEVSKDPFLLRPTNFL